jgi:tetratricopeptide (TPR) repeat protein
MTTATLASSEKNTTALEEALGLFKKITEENARFHALSLSLLGLEIFLFILLYGYLQKTLWITFLFGAILFTLISYFVIKLYLDSKKPDSLIALKDYYLDLCKKDLLFSENSKEFHLRIATDLYSFSLNLKGYEYQVHKPLSKSLIPFFRLLSCFFHWKEVFFIREQLMQLSIDEHIQLVQLFPNDLETHASLAESFMLMSRLYAEILAQQEPWIKKSVREFDLEKKFLISSDLALEELNIVETLSTQTPWSLSHKASIYHELKRPFDEISCYEKILEINPQDDKVIYRLGVLYFNQGLITNGLNCYQKLKENGDERASTLIQHYDARFNQLMYQYKTSLFD